MDRARFVALLEEGLYSMTELCERFGISRKTGYKWKDRYEEGGVEALQDRSRAPHSCPHRTDATAEAALVAARQRHPRWGPKKLLPLVQKHQPDLPLPVPSTAGEILQRHGLIPRQPRRRHHARAAAQPLVAAAPNQVWCADFKGEFKTRDGQWCYPLTITDAYSRCLLACEGLTSTGAGGAQAVFERVFQEYGLPAAIRTDNGTPFASPAIAGLSTLSVWWIKLGIARQRIRPGKPQENGRHERMHRTLKAETMRPPAADLASQQERFDRFRAEFNHERPHEALAQQPPATHYERSRRELPALLPQPEYAGHYLVRQVGSEGCIRLRSDRLFVSRVLCGEQVGLEEEHEGVWSVYYFDLLLGRFTAGDWQLRG